MQEIWQYETDTLPGAWVMRSALQEFRPKSNRREGGASIDSVRWSLGRYAVVKNRSLECRERRSEGEGEYSQAVIGGGRGILRGPRYATCPTGFDGTELKRATGSTSKIKSATGTETETVIGEEAAQGGAVCADEVFSTYRRRPCYVRKNLGTLAGLLACTRFPQRRGRLMHWHVKIRETGLHYYAAMLPALHNAWAWPNQAGHPHDQKEALTIDSVVHQQ
ncbi:hypothetical protein NM208_g12773 [Fusarium decemcellulare]|uniref:Uncharacterized protein n=1 Tax=Fusarium decemcellulare TaxID=57161 RepID=A0ACC1RQ29_9HYPO|nr:hypothetical protein NM208_g12773 [Fusarium decemcellulare]